MERYPITEKDHELIVLYADMMVKVILPVFCERMKRLSRKD